MSGFVCKLCEYGNNTLSTKNIYTIMLTNARSKYFFPDSFPFFAMFLVDL